MPKTTETPLDTAIAESEDAMATMESEAAEFFAARDAAKGAPLNPVAPALEKAAAKPSSAAASTPPARAKQPASAAALDKATPPPAASTATAKVPGAPRLRPTGKSSGTPEEGALRASGTPSSTQATEPAANGEATDFSDVPREYTPGQTRAPQWNKLHAKADHYEALSTQRAQEIADLQSALEAAKTATASNAPSPEITQRLQTLQQERDALQARLEAVAVEKSPRFEAQFKPRRDAALQQAKNAVGPADAAKIEQLLAMGESSYRDEQVEAFLSTLPPLRATKLTQAVADLDRLAAERASLASQGSELWKTWTAEESAARERANQERIARATQTFEAELKDWEAAGVTAEEAAAARSVYTGKDATLQDASRAALWGAVGPRVATALQEAQARIGELEGELQRLRGAQPGVGASSSGSLPASNGHDDDDPSVTGYADRIAKEALRAGLRFS